MTVAGRQNSFYWPFFVYLPLATARFNGMLHVNAISIYSMAPPVSHLKSIKA